MKSELVRSNNPYLSLPDFLSWPVEEAFQWIAKTLEARHSVISYQEDVDIWYRRRAYLQVSQAVAHKRAGEFDVALEIYDRLFQEMPTWAALYSSVYKVLAPAGRLKEAELAIQVNTLLLSIKYALYDSELWVTDHDFDLKPDNPYSVLAFWPAQDPSVLKHLGAMTMLKQQTLTPRAAKAYLNSIQGCGSTAGEPDEEILRDRGKEVLLELPWVTLSSVDNPDSFVRKSLLKMKNDMVAILGKQFFLTD
ncbi:hypothetical protein [Oscillatoria sp. HE19RPO]|uniref:hypothetical protein n=1 Tax=Oscillatoria sp. HE19RPO TaxID=2954806 RepID=UPI0020C468AA|nr:hypothetical protein [Oscillatoria sp. HE19RPO]